ncbi:MAG: hypothetical protein ACRDH8_14485 [Actinomycetota bacterium]
MSEAVLERALTDLGRHLAWPAEPDLAPVVLEGIAGVRPLPAPARRPPRRRIVLLAAATLLMVLGGLVAFSPGIRAAILRFLGLPGVRIEMGATPPPSSPADELRLGRRVTLAEAEAEVNFELVFPALLGDPDRVHLSGIGSQPIVSMVYEPRSGLPAAEGTDVGAVLSQFRATTDEQLIRKLTDSDATVESVDVDDELGYWVEGPHTVMVLDENGNTVEDRARLAGNTLLWSRDGITYRLEADIGKAEALRLAGSVR